MMFLPLLWTAAAMSNPSFVRRLAQSKGTVILSDGSRDPAGVEVVRKVDDSVSHWSVSNRSSKPVKVREIVLFDGEHGLPSDTPIYGEGFTMLSHTYGTLEKPIDLGAYTDRAHYRIPEPEGLRTVYGMLTLHTADGKRLLAGFSSSKRFVGRIGFDGRRLRISEDTENLTLAPGQTWRLEDQFSAEGSDREVLFDRFTSAIAKVQPRLGHDPVPTGWCSWYCFGPGVTAKDVSSNLGWMKTNMPALRYVQIDDGYQPWMGDWLETGKAFGGGVQEVLKDIAKQGFQPAIWVAPFVASPESSLFKNHPDWFVKGDDGQPLRSDKIGFGGWRLGPWYVLDGTHPQAQKWLEETFRTMRHKWGITYFKLDANYWGAMHGGHHYDPSATRVEAYRRGMEAILRGAGKDSFILGCNHPLWPSIGLIHGSRSSMDVSRSWESYSSTGRENLYRSWQNGRLWWNDPDCLLLGDESSKDVMGPAGETITTGDVPESEVLFHATLLHAVGGMLLSGDNLPSLTPQLIAILKKTVPPTGHSFRFADESFTVGRLKEKGGEQVAVFNWTDMPETRSVAIQGTVEVFDQWTGKSLGRHSGSFMVPLPPRSARLFKLTG